MDDKKWTVWVGGVEVNDYLLTFEQAMSLQASYSAQGYDDVIMQEVNAQYEQGGTE